MGYNLKDACNGCAECVQCRLAGETSKVYYCDVCGDDCSKDKLRRYNDQNVCRECFLEMMDEEWRELPEVQDEED